MNSADVVVIGGGILGAFSSYFLAKNGYKVIVVEKGNLAGGASGGNLGNTSFIDRSDRWHLELAISSMKIYEEVLAEKTFCYMPNGGFTILTDDEQYLEAKKKCAVLNEQGVPTKILEGIEIEKNVPLLNANAVRAVVHSPFDGTLNPFEVTLAIFDLAKALGVRIYTNTPVTAFEKEGAKITSVITGGEKIKCSFVINAGGSWAGEIGKLAGVNIDIRSNRGTAFVSHPIARILKTPIIDGGFLTSTRLKFGGGRHISVGITQGENGSILISQITEESSLDNKDVSPQGLSLLARRFLSYYPSLSSLEIVRTWAAMTPFCKDGYPYFGFCGDAENMLTAAGFKGAFSTAPAIGQRVAQMIEGNCDWDISLFVPNRIIQ